ncbi:hypothetical protein [Corynebacterium pelargi]|uniref:Uncharacterized protein n=1 Tax=Corynebacterium pelargi TaxID=1471400 RepID=A0A410WA72_9CORY|nr:hypothetical protein [Corynebacterium pelargi]QAU52868.1 hypothetical protein CPELA_08060 [Corynebacterium pelargi]GGG76407.1 hypothetical protein GCM10007338_12670 [Corynebacterium pelargi]
MSEENTATNVENTHEQAEPLSKSTSFCNPDGDLFLTGQERVMLESVLEDGVSNGAQGMEAAGW